MLTEMPVAFTVSNVFSTDVAHLVPAYAGEFVAAGRFDERGVAARTGSFDGEGHGQFDLSPEGEERRFVTYMDIVPGLGARKA